jgi:transposase
MGCEEEGMIYKEVVKRILVMEFRRRGHSVAEIAKYSKISKSTIYRWLQHG